MSLLSERQLEAFEREISIEQLEPVRSGAVNRNSQYRVYQIGGNFYAVEVAVPSGWFMSVEQINEADIPNYTK